MRLTFQTVDVFTETCLGGNPLAIVEAPDKLDDALMQRIAREFNLSETVFVFPPDNPAHSAQMRIFTPVQEVPFAGHPTVGTAAVLAEKKYAASNGNSDCLIVLEQQVGNLRVGVRLRPGAAPFAEFDAPRLPSAAGSLQAVDLLAAGLGLIPSEIGFENHRPVCYAAGNAFAFVPVSTREAIAKARINGEHWAKAFRGQGFLGVYLYTRQCEHKGSAFHARMFAPDAGVPEDPATGSAAVGLAGVIHQFDDLPDGTHRRTVEQGFEMGRPSFISLALNVVGDELKGVRIGGHAVQVSNGVMSI